MAASESAQCSMIASPRRSADVTPGRRLELGDVDAGQGRADRAHADHRLDLGRRPVGDDACRGPSARPGRRSRRPPRGSASRTRSSCRGRRSRASCPRSACRPSTSIATVGSSSTSSAGIADEGDREADALGLAARELLRAALGDRADADELDHVVDVEAAAGRARPSSRAARAPRGRGSATRSGASRRSRRPGSRRSGAAAEERHRPAVRRRQPEQHVDRRRLAGAVRARAAPPSRRRAIETSMPRTACTGPCGDAERLRQAAQLDAGPGRDLGRRHARESPKPVPLPAAGGTQT